MSNALKTQTTELTQSQRFTEKVLAEFKGGVGELAITDFQRRLVQNYFISIDMGLKKAEQNRLKKSEKYRDALPVTWANVNMESLSQAVVHTARLGLDPLLPNHVYFIPYKNNSLQKYDMTIIEGYKGKELKAVKYGLDVPETIIFELVYSTDVFKPIKKSFKNPVESYEFEIVNPFKRGEVIGGFAYFMDSTTSTKNRLMMMSVEDFEKRKPDKASPEFWGGEKDEYIDGKKTGKKEAIAGWYEEMCLKTLKRAAYGSITIDSQKIDDSYQFLKSKEMETLDTRLEAEIDENANSEVLDVSFTVEPEPIPETTAAFTEPVAETTGRKPDF